VVEGSRVRLKDIREPAKVRRVLGHGRIEVEVGFLKMQVSLEDVVEVLPATAESAKLPKNVTLQRGPDFSVLTREINVIGKHAEEAREEVDKFLDNAVLGSIGHVRIVHGHGMGILKRMVRELLADHPHVASYTEASPAEGGAGATIAVMRSD
jgi:DNA mismatch repair protein MutS2